MEYRSLLLEHAQLQQYNGRVHYYFLSEDLHKNAMKLIEWRFAEKPNETTWSLQKYTC
jgi:hypothetical protein